MSFMYKDESFNTFSINEIILSNKYLHNSSNLDLYKIKLRSSPSANASIST